MIGETSISDEDQQRVVHLLEMDVSATVGGDHKHEIIEAATRIRDFADAPGDYEQRVVDDIQQRFHDTFVDTSWPPCPYHSNHRCGSVRVGGDASSLRNLSRSWARWAKRRRRMPANQAAAAGECRARGCKLSIEFAARG
jgi:hypothetical protein